MTYKVKIKFEDETLKEFTIGSNVDLPSGLGLNAPQLSSLLSLLNSLTSLMSSENWKTIELEQD